MFQTKFVEEIKIYILVQ